MKIIILPSKKTIQIYKGNNLLEVLLKNGYYLNSVCGGKGKCGKCKVRILKGDQVPDQISKEFLTKSELKMGWRLACRTNLSQDTTIELEHKIQNIEHGGWKAKVGSEKWEMGSGKWEGQKKKGKRQKDKGAKIKVKDEKQKVKDEKRSTNHELQTTNYKLQITRDKYGVAFDIGTTTIAGSLLNLSSGDKLAVSSMTNPQVKYGADVISRINFASTNKNGLKILQGEVIGGINEIISNLISKANNPPIPPFNKGGIKGGLKINRNEIKEAVFVGNTCMSHLLAGVNPESLGHSPFTPVFKDSLSYKAAESGIEIAPDADIYIMPLIAGFVGGDTVGLIISTNLMARKGNIIAIDIGTNGEIVVKRGKEAYCCSVAAGPAFEGRNIKFGMRADRGAIEKITLSKDKKLKLKIIGNTTAKGICGSGVIELISLLLKYDIVDKMGHMIKAKGKKQKGKGSSTESLLKNVIQDGSKGSIFKLTDKIHFTQHDIFQVQLAKSAIISGVEILMKELNLSKNDINEVILSGAFTGNIKEQNFIDIGLLPEEFKGKIVNVGNGALAGAEIALISQKNRLYSESISKKINYIELAGRKDFEDAFINNLKFPEI